MSEEKENERGELVSGHTIGWWKNLQGVCCAVGVVLSVLIGVISFGLDQLAQPKDGQKQFEQPRVYVNEKGNLVQRRCDSSGSAFSAAVTIAGLIIAWGYIWWLRFLIKERIERKTWCFKGNWPDINKKLTNGYIVFEVVVLYGALKSGDYILHWRLAWYCWIIVGVVSYLVVEIVTKPLFERIIISEDERREKEQLDRRFEYEFQREEEYKAGKPFRVERWNYPSQEMVVLGTYVTLDEAENRMVEAVEIACEQEQGLSCEEARKRSDEARREGYCQMRDAEGRITSVFLIPKPLNTCT